MREIIAMERMEKCKTRAKTAHRSIDELDLINESAQQIIYTQIFSSIRSHFFDTMGCVFAQTNTTHVVNVFLYTQFLNLSKQYFRAESKAW